MLRDTARQNGIGLVVPNGRHDDATAVETAIALLRGAQTSLAPIIGERGVAALYQRSVHLCTSRFPWLAEGNDSIGALMNLEQLRLALARQSSADAAAAGVALNGCFHDLLISLVGESLALRLLDSHTPVVANNDPPGDNER